VRGDLPCFLFPVSWFQVDERPTVVVSWIYEVDFRLSERLEFGKDNFFLRKGKGGQG